jgi:3-hydroxyisobutyrate dehydrogenase
MVKAFLGMGLLGANFVRAMRKRGEDVQIWNRTASKAEALKETGAKPFATPAEAVKGAKLVHICVSDDAVVDSILEQASANFEPDVIIIDHTTTTATGTTKRATYWKSKGITFIHAPVFMGPVSALEGTGIMLISGDQRVIGQIEPELKKMTGELMNLGEDVSKAAAYKLLGNHLFLAISAGLTDTFTLGKALNFSREEVADLIEHIGAAPMKARVGRLLMGNYDDPTWELAMARKDARLMTEEAVQAQHELMVMPALGEVMDKLIAEGHGSKDWTVFAKKATA